MLKLEFSDKCAQCVYYHESNNTCQSKKCGGVSDGTVTWFDRIFCIPYKSSEEDKHYSTWEEVTGVVTPGGDPAWRCPVCGGSGHIMGVETLDNHINKCDQCGADLKYPWEK